MSKKLVIIIVSFVIVITLIAGGIFIFKNKEPVEKELNLSDSLLCIETVSDISAIEDTYGVKAENILEDFIFTDVSFLDLKTNFILSFDTEETLINMSVFSIIDKEIKSGSNFKKLASDLLEKISNIFGVEIKNNFYIFTDSGVLDNTADESYEKILNGEASLEFRLREDPSSFWVLKIEKAYNEQLVFTLEHYINNLNFEETIANIDLS